MRLPAPDSCPRHGRLETPREYHSFWHTPAHPILYRPGNSQSVQTSEISSVSNRTFAVETVVVVLTLNILHIKKQFSNHSEMFYHHQRVKLTPF